MFPGFFRVGAPVPSTAVCGILSVRRQGNVLYLLGVVLLFSNPLEEGYKSCEQHLL